MLTLAPGRWLALACCLACCPMSLLLAAPAAGAARAQPEESVARRLDFDFPAQPLDKALSAFGSLTGHSVLVDSAMTQGRTARAVRGSFEPEEALRQLLQGTGLTARFSGRQAFTLTPEPAPLGSAFPALPPDTPLTLPGPATAPALTGLPPAASADFAGALQAAITKAMCAAQPEHVGRYRAALQLWIAPDGRIRQARLLESSGLKARDAHLLAQLKGLAMGRVPPPELAQPLTILLSPKPDPAAACRRALGEVH